MQARERMRRFAWATAFMLAGTVGVIGTVVLINLFSDSLEDSRAEATSQIALERKKPPPEQQVQKPKPKPKPVASKPKPQAKPAPKPEPVEQPKPEPRLTEAELAALTRADLARALDEEEEFVAEATAEEMAASYAALIQQTVVNYWSRPPSARNGMEALLQIQLIPTGEVVSVSVLKSSGNGAFDRSAINAVEKAGSFPELKNLPPREFERTFRRFRLLFRPEDLRY